MTGTDEARDPAPDSSEAEVPPFHPDLLEVYLRRRISGGGVYFGLILLLLATLVSLPLVEVPIAVRAEGYLRASAETHSLIAPSSGEVAWVRARDRRSVARGDTILLLNRPDLYVRLEAIRARRVSVEQECRDLERLIAWVEGNGPPERPVNPRYREESKSIVAELESIGGQLRSSRREAFRSAALFARGLTAAAQSVAMEDRVEELRQDSVILRMQTAVRWRGELARLRQELSDLWTEEAAGVVEVEKLAITAPAAGVLDEIAGLSRGSFVPAGQPIGTLTPASPVVAELYVRPDELDAIHLGSPVRLQLASRRFTRGGTVRGSVVEIQPELVRASQGSAGRILVAPRWPVGPETPAERRTGRANELRRGSTVIARIPVARRSLWALVLRRSDDSTGGTPSGSPSGEPTVE